MGGAPAGKIFKIRELSYDVLRIVIDTSESTIVIDCMMPSGRLDHFGARLWRRPDQNVCFSYTSEGPHL